VGYGSHAGFADGRIFQGVAAGKSNLRRSVSHKTPTREAALITRREETAAMRMQANTARILDSSPTLMRLRELEVLEKVAEKSNLTVLLGDGSGLSDKVVKLL